MTKNKYNQFVASTMRAEKPDTEKLVKLATFIRQNFQLTVDRESILMFDKNDGHLKDFGRWITKEQYDSSKIHVPDLWVSIKGKRWIIEIDGWIHTAKTFVVRKDIIRNEDYARAKLSVIIIDEVKVLFDLGVTERRAATPWEIWPVLEKKLKEIV